MQQITLFGWILLSYAFLTPSWADDEVRLLIDTRALTLELIKGNQTIALMENIAIGRNGAGFKQHFGDDVTPIGTYKISWINNDSSFYRFYGFSYPSVDNADKALRKGLLSKKNHTAIINAHIRNILPPQNTSIGGRIGLHGLGAADKAIHKMMNWTHGCIALTNQQMDLLLPWLSKGVQVIIK